MGSNSSSDYRARSWAGSYLVAGLLVLGLAAAGTIGFAFILHSAQLREHDVLLQEYRGQLSQLRSDGDGGRTNIQQLVNRVNELTSAVTSLRDALNARPWSAETAKMQERVDAIERKLDAFDVSLRKHLSQSDEKPSNRQTPGDNTRPNKPMHRSGESGASDVENQSSPPGDR
jgi:hypothetical protein